ncbi:MAG: hypothetical protein IJV71_07015 [Lachnospiraceae bacterium]|nr:hypothetical protein [Lachnospiraceae bacterium]
MDKVASTSDIIKLLQKYEEEHGPGAVTGIGTVCQGNRTTEYYFYIEDKDRNDYRVDIPSVIFDSMFKG